DLRGANLYGADFTQADLVGATLEQAILIKADFRGANLSGCKVYGISAWGVQLDDKTVQKDLVITPSHEPTITVDDLEVAQFTYLLLNNQKIRNVINPNTTKFVLILGRFIS